MLGRPTKTTSNYNRETKNLSSPSSPLIASNQILLSSSPIASFTLPVAQYIDAILLSTDTREHLVNQPQNSSKNLTHSMRTTVVPDSSSRFYQDSQQYQSDTDSLIRKQQLVNPKRIVALNQHIRRRVAPRIIANRMIKHIYNLSILLAILCALFITSQQHVAGQTASLATQLYSHKVTPDVINIPGSVKAIKFEINGNVVKTGDIVPVKLLKDLPKVSLDVNNPDARYTLLLVDLDRKPNNSNSAYNQFTSFNIPGNAINLGQDMVVYEAPVVPCHVKHRLLMLALHQQQNIDVVDIAYMSASSGHSARRENFKLNDFINKHRLEVIAANLFIANGDASGTCSGSFSLHSQGLSSIMIAMVISVLARRFFSAEVY